MQRSNRLPTQEMIKLLPSAARDRLRDLFQARAAMLPISVSYAQPQTPADPWAIFELRKSGASYTLTPTAAGPSLVPAADGMFVYVVRADDPGRVYVGVPYGRVGVDQELFGVQGHTSLTGRADVLYAGEIILDQGRLVSWGNSSGHYRPPAAQSNTNLLPVTQTLLPQARFTDYWQHDNAARQAELGQLRGYLNMMDPQAPSSAATSASASTSTSTSDRLRLRVGNTELSLQSLMQLGARIDDTPWQEALRRPTAPALLQNGLADRLSFDGAMLERQIRAGNITGIEDLLFELAGQRTRNAPFVRDVGSPPRPWIAQINTMLNRVQTLSAMVLHQPRQNVVTCLPAGGVPIRHTAVGLHLFGLYNGVGALRTAVARGDVSGSVLAGSELAAVAVGVGAEEGLQRLGVAAQRGMGRSLDLFSRTSIGMRLGGPSRLGGNLVRAAPLAGALITAPFDAYGAYDSFSQAGQSSGREAQDHYVDGGLATASFVTTVGLGAAGYAGLSSTGPIGLGVAAFLIVAGRTYHSVRYVENLQQQIPLSMGEVISTGLLNVLGMGPPQGVQNRLAISTAAAGYRRDMQQRLQSTLGHLGQLGVSHVVFGDAVIALRAPLRKSRQVLTATPAGNIENTRIVEVPQAPMVIGNSGDDDIDAAGGLEGLANVARITPANDDKVLWLTGTGNDTLVGVWNRSNLFDVRGGKKLLRGGNEPDRFELNVVPEHGSSFDGGLAADTLLLSFASQSGTTLEVALAGHLWLNDYRHIEDHAGDNYQMAGSRQWATYPRDMPGPIRRLMPGWIVMGGQRSYLKSVENVVTSANATTRIYGNGQDNVFVLNGHDDSVDGGLGDDTYIIQGGGAIRVKAGAGTNRYQLQRTIGTVAIDSARTGQHTLHLDFYLHELLFEVREQSVEISIAGNAGQRIVLEDIYRAREGTRHEPVRPDGQLRIMTRDAMAVTPLFSKVDEDGLIELLAKPWSDPAVQGADRFATAREIQQLDQLVAASGGWQAAPGMAQPLSGGGLSSAQAVSLLGSTLAMAA